jgi:hypothetical protein
MIYDEYKIGKPIPKITNECVFKGTLIKKNWYGKKQLRFLKLVDSGELQYYKGQNELKGSITIGPMTEIKRTEKTVLNITCLKKKREYILI